MINYTENIKAKYGIENSFELALRIARKYRLISRHDYVDKVRNKDTEYIPCQHVRDGISFGSLGYIFPPHIQACRVLWSRGLTFGKYDEGVGERETTDLENRLLILDGANQNGIGLGWLSARTEKDTREIQYPKDPRLNDGQSGWYRGYAFWLLREAYGFCKTFRTDTTDGFQSKRDLQNKVNYAIGKRIHAVYEANQGPTGKITKDEIQELREIWAEANLCTPQNHEKWEPQDITLSEWEEYKRTHLNSNHSLLKRIYNKLKGGLE